MKRHVYNCQAGCPVESTLQIISGKWKSVILYHFIKNDVCHFGELQRNMKDCSRRMLALQLKELESDGVIEKTIYPVMPPRTDYKLTAFGKTLIPVIKSMEEWGNYYNQRKIAKDNMTTSN
ncbi:winged helix-turn-helix transcriptional regulator [Liquorilactobacillus mali]|uniref:winged helix-turn-helix transcriptional regulator n=1 Tax=Liquorilactobacillus mali TaxID=1618 RepID=UPI0002492056|nr:helix-turn-helix domain-containing protein [Liquorilactobacillus mali]EJF01055.1 cinnamoyl ester hydrolase-like protein [Liquorilactobacillus mali KCTC 3596 = DSM 20444]MDC7953347.1 helix-turn-helix transcriptional regulator [Liquorilactobacillus mali]QFQ75471.1 helix-turn-helix transcriptional regulator [Liquorilactobacillus mali]